MIEVKIEDEFVKCKTLKGVVVEGHVVSRLERTMVIRGVDGSVHFCWIDAEKEKSLKAINSPQSIKCKATEPSGEVKVFDSITDAAKHYGVSQASVSKRCKEGKPALIGILKGYKFEKLEAVK